MNTKLLPSHFSKSDCDPTEQPIGIDLGYRQACVAVYKDNQVKIIPAEDGKPKTPTFLSYSYDHKHQQFTNLVGTKAVAAIKNGEKCMYDTKRIIGRSYQSNEVQNLIDSNYFPFKISDEEVPMLSFQYSHWENDAESFHCEALTAKVLVHLKQLAEKHLNHATTQVVITVPATFNSFQRLAVQNAGKLAGFKDVVSITEATAAVIAYYNDFPSLTEEILVFDLGLSSFDLTLLNVDKGKIRVRAAVTDPNLGGWMVTKNLRAYTVKRYKDQRSKEYEAHNMDALFEECEAKKKMLSVEGCELVSISYKGHLRGSSTVSRKLFAELNLDFISKCFAHLDKFLANAKFNSSRVERVILVGGSTKIPEIRQRIKSMFGHAKITHSIDEETVVARGAAIHASNPTFTEYGYEEDFMDKIDTIPVVGVITSGALGVRIHSNKLELPNEGACRGVIIPSGTQTPCHMKKRFKCIVKNGNVEFDVYYGKKENLTDNDKLCSLKSECSDLPDDGVCHFDIDMYLSASGLLKTEVKYIGWISDSSQTEESIAIPKDFSIHCLKELKSYGDEFAENVTQLWSTDCQIQNQDIYTAGQIDVAKATYQDRMDAAVSNFEVLSDETLKDVHNKAVTIALETLLKSHPLTFEGYQEARKPLNALYSKYVKLNGKKKSNPCKYTVGLDLGTTFCSAAFVENDHVQAIDIDMTKEGDGKQFRSILTIAAPDSIHCGNAALPMVAGNPGNFIFDLKRMIGQHIKDPQVQKLKRYWPFALSSNNNNIEILAHGTAFRPEELLVHLIKSIAKMVKEHLNEKMVNVVVAIPAYFKPLQVRLTKQACLDAGLNVVRFVQEPIAAVLAYSRENNFEKDISVMIVDLGGGTFDVAVVHIRKNGIEIVAVDGDPFLGGQDIDNALVEHCVQEFENKFKVNLRQVDNSPRWILRLKSECEKTKILLSMTKKTILNLDQLCGKDFVLPIHREKLEDLIKDFVEKYFAVVNRMVAKVTDLDLDIDKVVMVGGSSRVPIIRRKLEDMFGNKVIKDKSINADLAVASGAAILASRLQNQINDELIADSMQKLLLGN